VADEAEAFVQGTLLDVRREHAMPIPTWLWLNQLAHGSLADLRQLGGVTSEPGQPAREDAWAVCTGRLARHMLARATTPTALRQLQQRALWPLEREVIDGGGTLVNTPHTLLTITLGALARDGRDPHDPSPG
jgi:hypothetical protein